MKRYMKAWLGISLLLALLTSCTPAKTEQSTVTTSDFSDRAVTVTHETATVAVKAETTEPFVIPEDYPYTYYLPEEEWEGLETSAYRYLDPAFVGYIQAHPQGTPDPDYTKQGTVPYVTVETVRPQYSLSRDEGITVRVTYEKAEDSAEQMERVFINGLMNLERWNGTEWERMLYVISELYIEVVRAPYSLSPGNSYENFLPYGGCVTLLTPGQYRAIAYVNNTALYAEFELTE